MLTQLMYHSRESSPFSESGLISLLEQSRRRNAASGITGLLLYGAGQFIQVLEGPDEAVADVFASITRDFRHRELMVLLEEAIEYRAFADWSMGFRRFSKADLDALPGFSNFLDESLIAPASGDISPHAQQLLTLFKAELAQQDSA